MKNNLLFDFTVDKSTCRVFVKQGICNRPCFGLEQIGFKEGFTMTLNE